MPKDTILDFEISYRPGAVDGEVSSAELELIKSILPNLIIEMIAIDETGKERHDSGALCSGLDGSPSGE